MSFFPLYHRWLNILSLKSVIFLGCLNIDSFMSVFLGPYIAFICGIKSSLNSEKLKKLYINKYIPFLLGFTFSRDFSYALLTLLCCICYIDINFLICINYFHFILLAFLSFLLYNPYCISHLFASSLSFVLWENFSFHFPFFLSYISSCFFSFCCPVTASLSSHISALCSWFREVFFS